MKIEGKNIGEAAGGCLRVTWLLCLRRKRSELTGMKSQKKEEWLSIVRGALQKAEGHCRRYRPWDGRLLVISIVCGALATLLAGGAVAGGNDAMKALGGWKVVCSIVAVLTALGTSAGATHKSLQITLKVANAERCVARLRSLEVGLVSGVVTPDEALATYQKISEEHAVCLV